MRMTEVLRQKMFGAMIKRGYGPEVARVLLWGDGKEPPMIDELVNILFGKPS